MPDFRTRLGMFKPDGPDDSAWTPMVKFWALIFRWTGRGYPWIMGGTECCLCHIEAEEVEFAFDRVGRGKFVCVDPGSCEDNITSRDPEFFFGPGGKS